MGGTDQQQYVSVPFTLAVESYQPVFDPTTEMAIENNIQGFGLGVGIEGHTAKEGERKIELFLKRKKDMLNIVIKNTKQNQILESNNRFFTTKSNPSINSTICSCKILDFIFIRPASTSFGFLFSTSKIQ